MPSIIQFAIFIAVLRHRRCRSHRDVRRVIQLAISDYKLISNLSFATETLTLSVTQLLLYMCNNKHHFLDKFLLDPLGKPNFLFPHLNFPENVQSPLQNGVFVRVTEIQLLHLNVEN